MASSMPVASLVLEAWVPLLPNTICEPETCLVCVHCLGLYGSIGLLRGSEQDCGWSALGVIGTGVFGLKGYGVLPAEDCPDPAGSNTCVCDSGELPCDLKNVVVIECGWPVICRCRCCCCCA